MLDVPRELILFVSGLLAVRRRQIGTRRGTRRLGCYRQALFALAWFRDKGDIPRLGRGFGLPQSTAYRYQDEVIEVLAARAPGLQEQLERALAEGVPYLILDGKVVDTDRCREKTLSRKGKVIDLWYAGKTHDFGGNIQALFYPCGIPLWISDVLPGNVSRGRDRHCWRPPAQIPASGITALGSCHGYLAANRAWGQGCLILVVGR